MIIHKGKNVFPLTTLQASIDTFTMMFGIAVYGQFIGSFSAIIKELAEKRIYFERISNALVVTLE